jgi:signal transduction histidine kinase
MGRAGQARGIQPVDVVIALALTISSQVEIWSPDLAPALGEVTGSRPLLAVTTALMTVPLAVRRVFPLAACVLVVTAQVVQQQSTTPTEGLSTLLALLVASYSVGAHAGRRNGLLGAGAIAVGSFFIGSDSSDHLFVLVVLGAACGMGLVVGHRNLVVDRLAADKRDLEERHELAAARGAAEERVRIARDLHDVVAHRVSMIVVQAQAADAALDKSPEEARESMRAVERTGRQALEELRSLLGVLHQNSPDARAPQPDLDEIEQLVHEARSAGVPVTMATEGDVVPVAPSVGMAAYRVVQESLTNVLKHAPGQRARVVLRFHPGLLEVTVTNEGFSESEASGPGHGLAGMRERVRFAGGDLSSGPLPSGEFEVRATLPLEEPVP